jgi:hypothetical protein
VIGVVEKKEQDWTKVSPRRSGKYNGKGYGGAQEHKKNSRQALQEVTGVPPPAVQADWQLKPGLSPGT